MCRVINISGHSLTTTELYQLRSLLDTNEPFELLNNPKQYKFGQSLNAQLRTAVTEIRPQVQPSDVIIAPSIRNAKDCAQSLFRQAIVFPVIDLYPDAEQRW